MKVLGLDMSTHLGYAFIDSENGLTQYGTHTPDANFPAECLPLTTEYKDIFYSEKIADFVRRLVVDHPVDLILIEQTNSGAFRTAQKQLEFIHFAVLSELRALGQAPKVRYIDTSVWRSILGIKLSKEQRSHNKAVAAKTERGKVTPKHLAVNWANQTYKLNLLVKDNDAADAICIATAGLRKHSQQITASVDLQSVFNNS